MSKRNPRKRPSTAEMNRRRAQIEEAAALKASSPTAKPLQVKISAKLKGGPSWDSLRSQVASLTYQNPLESTYQAYLDAMTRQILFGSSLSYRIERENQSPLKLPRRHIATPIVGYRSWKLTMADAETAVLAATGVTHEWAGTKIHAECSGGLEKRHKAPSPNCRCGIYAYTHPRPALAASYEVHGAIVAWGRVVEHGKEGFRAANAQVIALALRPESMFATYHAYWQAYTLTQEGAKRLGVPVVDVRALELYAREFGEHLA